MQENKSIFEYFDEYKKYIYPIFMLTAGLFAGVILFKYSNESFQKAISELFNLNPTSFTNELINHFSLYFSVYTLTILFGLCLVGFPIINIIPFSVGLELAIKLSFFYSTYNVKGIGYAVLMIIPEASAFATVLIFAIVKSNSLSKSIFDLISKKSGMTEEINLKSYLKMFLLYALIVAFISLLNTAISFFLSSIISI